MAKKNEVVVLGGEALSLIAFAPAASPLSTAASAVKRAHSASRQRPISITVAKNRSYAVLHNINTLRTSRKQNCSPSSVSSSSSLSASISSRVVRMATTTASAGEKNVAAGENNGSKHDEEKDEDGGMRANFIKTIVKRDLESGKHESIMTRFPPEPNGYLHLGHAKSICLNFGLAREFDGRTNLRFDDTNPETEDDEYVRAITRDVHWLVGEKSLQGDVPWVAVTHSSDWFEQMYALAEVLIKQGDAYVDETPAEELKKMRGTLTEPGIESAYRNRPVEESLDLFRRMRAGEFEDGEMVLRAKIDMSSSNMNMRDPPLYRIKKNAGAHQRTGAAWCIYPMYDYAHVLSDAFECITHSLCTLEFEQHRALYDWVLDSLHSNSTKSSSSSSSSGEDELKVPSRPRQIEFSRLNLQYTVLSKRKLIKLVEDGVVSGWDDPRMPTISGMRRRGYPPSALQLFAERVGISKAENNIDMAVLEDCVREKLEFCAPRAFAAVKPIKVVITNWPHGKTEVFEMPVHPKRPEMGTRKVPFSGELFIDHTDFALEPPPKYFRLAPGRRVRLKFAYVIECDEVVFDKDADDGEHVVKELRCTYLPDTRAGNTPEGMKRVKGIIQWLSCAHAAHATVRVYDRLFSAPAPGSATGEFLDDLNDNSLQELPCVVEQAVADACRNTTTSRGDDDFDATDKVTMQFQFERIGYFCPDLDCTEQRLVLNRVVTLRDTWGKITAKNANNSNISKSSGKKNKPKPKAPKAKGTNAKRNSHSTSAKHTNNNNSS